MCLETGSVDVYVINGNNTFPAAKYAMRCHWEKNNKLNLTLNEMYPFEQTGMTYKAIISTNPIEYIQYKIANGQTNISGKWAIIQKNNFYAAGDIPAKWSNFELNKTWSQIIENTTNKAFLVWQVEYPTGDGHFYKMSYNNAKLNGKSFWLSKTGFYGYFTYENDVLNGISRTYTPSNTVYSEKHYIGGRED